jgi:hypothetical protein
VPNRKRSMGGVLEGQRLGVELRSADGAIRKRRAVRASVPAQANNAVLYGALP